MISYLKGILVDKQPTVATIEVGGFGLKINIPLSTYEKLPDKGSSLLLHTHFHVREDEMSLYGFINMDELEMFRYLIGVSGIGPKVALGILSGTGIVQLKNSVREGDVERLTTIKGIGKKTAQRLIVELRDKLGAIVDGDDEWLKGTGDDSDLEENVLAAVTALETLGYARKQAFEAVKKSIKNLGKKAEPEELIRDSLRNLN